MFSLDDSMRHWLFTEPADMRKSLHMLSGIGSNRMSADLRNGDVFIFVNKSRNRIKLPRKEPGAIQSDEYDVYNKFTGMEGKTMLGCWAHAGRKNYLFCGSDASAVRASII